MDAPGFCNVMQKEIDIRHHNMQKFITSNNRHLQPKENITLVCIGFRKGKRKKKSVKDEVLIHPVSHGTFLLTDSERGKSR